MSLGSAITKGWMTGQDAQASGGVEGMLGKIGSAFAPSHSLDLTNPESVKAEIQRLQASGDQAGAIKMISHLRQIEGDQRRNQLLEREKQERTTEALTPVSANAARARQAEVMGKSAEAAVAQAEKDEQSTATIDKLRAAGMEDTAEMVENGTLSPKEGFSALVSRNKEDRSLAGSEAKRKATAQRKAVENKEAVIGAINTLARSDPQAARELAERYSDLDTMTDAEVAAVKAIVTSQKVLNPSDDDDSGVAEFEYKASTPSSRQVAGGYVERLDDMLHDNDMKEDGWAWADGDTSGYEFMMGEVVRSLSDSENISEIEAGRLTIELMEKLASREDNPVTNLQEMAVAIRQELTKTDADLAQYF